MEILISLKMFRNHYLDPADRGVNRLTHPDIKDCDVSKVETYLNFKKIVRKTAIIDREVVDENKENGTTKK